MKITDAGIDAWREANPVISYGHIVTVEERAEDYFSLQDTADIIDYVNSRTPREEIYLMAAVTECAKRADMLDRWLYLEGEFDDLWHEISRKLRKQIRYAKKAQAESAGGAS